MKNMMQNMKVYYEGDDFVSPGISDFEYGDNETEEITLLPTFPEYKDGEPQFWNGDILNCGDRIGLLNFNGFHWTIHFISSFNRIPYEDGPTIDGDSINIWVNNRICSAFNKNAAGLTGLNQKTIDQLREIVKEGK